MKLVVNGRFLLGPPTGIHRAARGLVDAARERGIPLEIFAPTGASDRRVDRVSWAPPGRVGEHLWEQFVLPVAAARRPIISLANTAPLMTRRSLLMVHDIGWMVDPRWFSRTGRLYGRLAAASAKRAVGILTPSRQVRIELIDAGFREDSVFVVRNALEEDFGPASPEEVAAARSLLALEGPYILCVGWADPRKDVATAVTAHLRVVGQVPHELILIGQTNPNFGLVHIPEAPSVRRLGYLPNEELRALLTGAAGLAFPSRYEGFGLPPVEALACGVPALVSDIPVLRESTAGAATYLPVGDVEAWAEAIGDAVRGEIQPGPPPAWRWADAAEQLQAALSALSLL
ncbi:MAG: glycosyltransferase family 4 protein [Actinomycetota bacterium]